jgi:hypothetical protein
MADRDDDDAPARSRRRHQKANRAATRRLRRALDAGPGTALCALLNLVHSHPIPITFQTVSLSIPPEARDPAAPRPPHPRHHRHAHHAGSGRGPRGVA